MKGYVINLKRREDRLDKFKDNIINNLNGIDIEVIEAVDGKEIRFDDEMKKRINPWNFKFLNEDRLRGVVGCCLSHLKVYEKMIQDNIDHCIVFEDDCDFINEEVKNNAIDILSQVKIPNNYGIIFLNNSFYKGKNYDDNLIELTKFNNTTEAYIINRKYAEILYKYNYNNIGAIDMHMQQCFSKNRYKHYILKNIMFCQKNRSDTDIQL